MTFRHRYGYRWSCCWATLGSLHFKTCRVRQAQEPAVVREIRMPVWQQQSIAAFERKQKLRAKALRLAVPKVLPQRVKCRHCRQAFRDGVHVVEDGYVLLGEVVHGACLGAFIHEQEIPNG